MMRLGGTGPARTLVAFAGATLISVAIFAALVLLNRAAKAEPVQSAGGRVRLHLTEQVERTEPEQVEPRDEPPPEVLEVDVDLPEPAAPPPPVPLELSLSFQAPALSPVRVAAQSMAQPPPREPQRARTARTEPAGPRSADQVDRPPRVVRGPQPSYPWSAQRREIEGEVRVRMLVGTDGSVREVQILEGPAVFHRTVRETVQGWRFDPAWDEGNRVEVWAVKSFFFQIED